MKDPRVVEIEFLSELEQNPPNSLNPWDWEKKLGVPRQFLADMALSLFFDRCLEGSSSIPAPLETGPTIADPPESWGDHAKRLSIRNVLRNTTFTAHINHKGRVRLWQLRDEVQRARTKEKFGILWDRRSWDSEVAIQLAMKDQSKPSAVLFMDLDHFKPINDTLGHGVGDDILRIFFQTVLKLTGTAGEVYGWGGDEVVVFLKEIEREAAQVLTAAIKTSVAVECGAQPEVAKSGLPISVSCGTHVFTGRETPTDIVKAADVLMYEDKARMKAQKQ